ncbi:MAG: nucleoside deaminase [Elainellaceae cyanobacterium]
MGQPNSSSDSNTPNPKFMEEAIALSFDAMRTNKGGPYGAVVVKDGQVIGRGQNRVTSLNDPTAHAEMLAIREACQAVESWTLPGCELYTSCEPCPMCMAATLWAKLDVVYYGNSKETADQFGFNSSSLYAQVTKAPAERDLSMVPYMVDEAVEAFKEWVAKSDKKKY